MLTPWKKSYDQPRQHIKKQRHYFANKGPSSQGYGFSSGHVWMWELDYKESWAPKNWCFWTVVLEKTLESPLDCKEIQPVHPRGDQSWVFIGRTEWSWNSNTLATWCEELIHWKRPWCWERLRAGEEGDDRGWDSWMASSTRWTWVWVDSGVGDGQGGLACCSSRGCKESDTSEWLNWTELLYNIVVVFAIHSRESAMVVLIHVFPIPPPFPSHPSGSSQCTSPKYPVSCIKPELAIYFTYGNIHVSVLFSQIIPPSPSPTESKSLFFTPVQWPSF